LLDLNQSALVQTLYGFGKSSTLDLKHFVIALGVWFSVCDHNGGMFSPFYLI